MCYKPRNSLYFRYAEWRGDHSYREEYIIYDGKQIGGKYESVISGGHSPINVNGKIAFSASNGCENDVYIPTCKQFIVYDGEELRGDYDSASATFDIGGKLAFSAKNCVKRSLNNRCERFEYFLMLEK